MLILSCIGLNSEVSSCIYLWEAIAPQMSVIAQVGLAIAFGLLGSTTNFG
jgi:hypothetical protein